MKTTDPQESILTDDLPTAADFKEWREALGWTRKEAAFMLKYSNASAISQIETGLRKVPQRVAVLMQLYDLTFKPFEGKHDRNTTPQP